MRGSLHHEGKGASTKLLVTKTLAKLVQTLRERLSQILHKRVFYPGSLAGRFLIPSSAYGIALLRKSRLRPPASWVHSERSTEMTSL